LKLECDYSVTQPCAQKDFAWSSTCWLFYSVWARHQRRVSSYKPNSYIYVYIEEWLLLSSSSWSLSSLSPSLPLLCSTYLIRSLL